MFSFVSDTVLDLFGGSGTTGVAAALAGRDSVAYDIGHRRYPREGLVFQRNPLLPIRLTRHTSHQGGSLSVLIVCQAPG